MTPAARLSAAVEVFADLVERRRPAPDALKDWGLAHRFAGSGDRAAIASLVYDALRRRASATWLMGSDAPRGVLLGSLRLARGMSADAIAALCGEARFAMPALSEQERAALDAGTLDGAPDPVRGDFPDWIAPSLVRAFGPDLVPEMEGLAARAPLDLRVNALKAGRDAVGAELAPFGAEPTPHSPWGLRVPPGPDGRGPSIQSDPAFLRGDVEIQDEGSQLVALLAGARPGEFVIDLCAGGGGKTLALAAAMEGRGRLIASDGDPRRLAPIHARLQRAGAGFVEVRTPRAKADPLGDLDGAADLVLVDAPCTGTGTWRRHPDAKWRLRPGSLSARIKDQATVLDRAARLVRPGGRVVYVTCSVLPEENDDAVDAFLVRRPDFAVGRVLAGFPVALSGVVLATARGVQTTPRATGTDGFYAALLQAR